jgi:hypothetical protein
VRINQPQDTMTTIKIKETIKTYENYGNPSHPCNGNQVLTVSVWEVTEWGEDLIENFGGSIWGDQDDDAVRAEALAYAQTQALADAEYCNRYQEFTARMEKTEWEY